MTIKISIDYFASLREQAGIASETISLTDTSARKLYQSLVQRHNFTLTEADLKLAVNDTFVEWSHVLSDGDRVVFIPPVSGG